MAAPIDPYDRMPPAPPPSPVDKKDEKVAASAAKVIHKTEIHRYRPPPITKPLKPLAAPAAKKK
jgi:hypothetical protein